MTTRIREALRDVVKLMEKIHHPAILERFVLRNGLEYTIDKWRGREMKLHECFKNAFEVVEQAKGPIKYVEGFGMRPAVGFPVQHAWVGNLDYKAYDPTWRHPEECFYLGVDFDYRTVCDQLAKNQVWGILALPKINTDLIYSIDPELEKIVADITTRKGRTGSPSHFAI